MTLLISNPPKSSKKVRRGGRSRRRSQSRKVRRKRAARRITVARRKRRTRRRSSFTAFTPFKRRRRRSSARRSGRAGTRRRSSSRGLGRLAGGFIPSGVLMSAGSAVGGFVGAHFIVNAAVQRLNMTQIAAGNMRIAAKAAAGLLGAFVLRRFLKVSPQLANGFAVGALTAAGADLWNKFSGKPLAGLGVIEIDGTDNYPDYGGAMLGEYEDLGNYAVAGSLPMDA